MRAEGYSKWFLTIFVVLFILFTIIQSADAGPGNASNRESRIKHIILMIGDGMGAWHVDAVRKYLNVGRLAMESLEHHGYMTTYAVNPVEEDGYYPDEFWDVGGVTGRYNPLQGGKTPWEMMPPPDYLQAGATDSAAAASAMASGFKTVIGGLNVVMKPEGYNWAEPFTVKFHQTIVDFADSRNMAAGLVTSVPFAHATPAAFAAKAAFRENSAEIMRQMLYSDVDVIMGAGHPYYDDNGEYGEPWFFPWSRNQSPYLTDEDGAGLYQKAVDGLRGRCFVDSLPGFQDLADGDNTFNGGVMPKRVFGLAPVRSTLQAFRMINDDDPSDDWKPFGQALIESVPSLSLMTRAALQVLQPDEDGFFLMVEGGAIDWASHYNWTTRMIEEGAAFDEAVQVVIDWVRNRDNGSNWDNTLLIVTADHECGQLMPVGDAHGLEVILGAAWGTVEVYGQPVPWGDHTNSLVPIYAQGPGAGKLRARFNGDYRDNTDIFKVMFGALKGNCSRPGIKP